MALNACTSCTTKFAVGLTKCPHCGSTEYVEDGDVMAKITRHGGASDDTVPTPDEETEAVDAPAPEDEETPAAAPEPEEEEGEEPAPEPSAEEPETASGPDYEAETVEQLRERLSERGLPKSGKRDDLVLRLLEDDDARAAEHGAE
jgi:hypothetical protein